jgi:hypothetical protein
MTIIIIECGVEGCSLCKMCCKGPNEMIIYDSVLAIVRDCVVQRTDSNQCHEIGEDTVRQVQNSDWLTVTGINWLKIYWTAGGTGRFELLCGFSKIRFVSIDFNDVHCCNEQINRLERNSQSVTDRLSNNFVS